MAKLPDEYVMKVRFEMATENGTTPLREVAEHAKRVALAWAEVGITMERLADAFDRLVANPETLGQDRSVTDDAG